MTLILTKLWYCFEPILLTRWRIEIRIMYVARQYIKVVQIRDEQSDPYALPRYHQCIRHISRCVHNMPAYNRYKLPSERVRLNIKYRLTSDLLVSYRRDLALIFYIKSNLRILHILLPRYPPQVSTIILV